MAQDAPRITTSTRWAYGSGGAGYGVLCNAHYFVLIYYSQVLGLGNSGAGVNILNIWNRIPQPTITRLKEIFLAVVSA